MFEQGDGVLARDAGEFLEGRDINEPFGPVPGGVLLERGDEPGKRLAVEEEVFAHADESARLDEQPEDFPRVFGPRAGAARARERVFERRGLQPRVEVNLFQAVAQPLVGGREAEAVAARTHKVTLRDERTLLFRVPERGAEQLRRGVRENLLAPRKSQRFNVTAFKEWTGVSRKYAIPLLEYFDRERVTRRAGDRRLIL